MDHLPTCAADESAVEVRASMPILTMATIQKALWSMLHIMVAASSFTSLPIKSSALEIAKCILHRIGLEVGFIFAWGHYFRIWCARSCRKGVTTLLSRVPDPIID
jgi:hypothetical protein